MVIMLLLYVASVGPLQYLAAHQLVPQAIISAGQILYLPLAILPEPIAGWIERYADWIAHL